SESSLVREEAGNLGGRVAVYQAGRSSCRHSTSPAPCGLPVARRPADGTGARGEEETAGVANCTKHWTEHAVAQCEEGGQPWCAQCLVPPPRVNGPLRCIPCSLVIAGVRARRRVR